MSCMYSELLGLCAVVANLYANYSKYVILSLCDVYGVFPSLSVIVKEVSYKYGKAGINLKKRNNYPGSCLGFL